MTDPIEQFRVTNLFPIFTVGGQQIAFTNSALFMILAVMAIAAFLLIATRSRSVVPGRLQSLAEMSYEFIADTVQNAAGREGMRFFPFVFSLFMFVLFVNLIGMIPYGFSVTSHIVITAALALLVFFTVIIYGFWKNGLHFLRLFAPSGVPFIILPLVSAIEVMSFFTRPLSHSVRLFANMLAGHIVLQLFAGFVTAVAAIGFIGWFGAVLPLVLTVALIALEFLVAFLQAYVFAILTCIYLNDALHPAH
jgi:F-type H+-transporting ATPase subunit a